MSPTRRIGQELEARVAELATVNLELEAFSYSVSHDLRAPLRHVTGFASLLQQHAGSALDDQARRYLDDDHRGGQAHGHADRRPAGVLADGPDQPSPNAPVDLSELVREARAEVSGGRSTAGASSGTSQPLPTVEADPALLRSVLVNLLSNAVKYTSTRDEARIEVGTRQIGRGEVVVFVRDNGVGFDMAYAAQAVRRVPAAAPVRRVQRHRHRPGQRAPHHPAPRRPHVGGRRRRSRARRSIFRCRRDGSLTRSDPCHMSSSAFCWPKTTPTISS